MEVAEAVVLPSRVLPVEVVEAVVHIRAEAVEAVEVAAAEEAAIRICAAEAVEVAGAAADNRHHNNDDDDVCLCRDRANIYL